MAFAGDAVNFDFKISAAGFAGEEAEIRLLQKDVPQPLATQKMRLTADGRPQTVRLTHRPETEGEFEYTVEIVPHEGEATVENNRETRTVQVRNATIRVLLVQSSPNHEFDFLKAPRPAAARRPGHGQEGVRADDDPPRSRSRIRRARRDRAARVPRGRRDELFAYDAVIFGDVNPAFLSESARASLKDFVVERGGGVAFIAGPQFMPLAWRGTALEDLLPMDLDTAALPNPDDALTAGFQVAPTAVGMTSSPMQLGRTANETADIWAAWRRCIG